MCFKNLTIKELHRISLIFLSNYLFLPKPNYTNLDLIKSSYHNYKNKLIIFFKNLTIKELHHISLILLMHILLASNIHNCFHLMQCMIESLKYLKFKISPLKFIFIIIL